MSTKLVQTRWYFEYRRGSYVSEGFVVFRRDNGRPVAHVFNHIGNLVWSTSGVRRADKRTALSVFNTWASLEKR